METFKRLFRFSSHEQNHTSKSQIQGHELKGTKSKEERSQKSDRHQQISLLTINGNNQTTVTVLILNMTCSSKSRFQGQKMNQSRSILSEIRSSPLKRTDDNHRKHLNGSSDTHHINQSTSTPGTLIERNKKQRKILPEISSSSTKTTEDNRCKHSNGSSGPNHMNLTDKIKNTSTPRTSI